MTEEYTQHIQFENPEEVPNDVPREEKEEEKKVLQQKDFQEGYYYKLSMEDRKRFKQEMCSILDILEGALLRRMRLKKFMTLEWKVVLDYMDRHPLNKEK